MFVQCVCVCVCGATVALSRRSRCELTAQLSVAGSAVRGILGNAVPSDKQAAAAFSLTTRPQRHQISTSNTPCDCVLTSVTPAASGQRAAASRGSGRWRCTFRTPSQSGTWSLG